MQRPTRFEGRTWYVIFQILNKFIDITKYNLYFFNQIVGDTGMIGMPGIKGDRGYPGAECAKGIQGPKGVPGLRGEPGKILFHFHFISSFQKLINFNFGVNFINTFYHRYARLPRIERTKGRNRIDRFGWTSRSYRYDGINCKIFLSELTSFSTLFCRTSWFDWPSWIERKYRPSRFAWSWWCTRTWWWKRRSWFHRCVFFNI